jgi:trehalose 6-phosphate synthase/phosphatase
MSGHPRLVIASNRLPLSAECENGELRVQPATGGLASALGAVHAHQETTWIGWPGDLSAVRPDDRKELLACLERRRIVPVELTPHEASGYYDGFCNGVLWPVFHYLIERLPLGTPDWPLYRAINERFADAVVSTYGSGDTIWLHDYHLLLAPALVRRRLPHARIGFFLHTPFPPTDVFSVLPWRRELLEGMLGATLVGFQTETDAAHFGEAVAALTDCQPDRACIVAGERQVRFGAYPIAIDAGRLAASPEADSDVPSEPLIGAPPGCKMLLGVDRLDYTKGIPRRLAAYQQFLSDHEEWRGRVQMIQVAVPSRGHVPEYQVFRRQVESLVLAINESFGTPDWIPVQYLHRRVCDRTLSSLYRSADVMLVTSLRDGMNLVAKEFIASRADEDGVLILSEFAGAARELREALIVNPFAVDQMAATIARALSLDEAARGDRMRALRRRVQGQTVERWVTRFTNDLARAASDETPHLDHRRTALEASAADPARTSLVFLYEESLVPSLAAGEPACPDPEILQLLGDLSMRAGYTVHVVSRRDLDTVDSWFAGVPATIWAEYGLWCRESRGRRWRRTSWSANDWITDVRELLDQFTATTPGAFVEEQPATLIWHFGRAERIHGQAQAQSLLALLRDASAAVGVEPIVTGSRVEIRPAGVGRVQGIQHIVGQCAADHRIFLFHGTPASPDLIAALRPCDVALGVSDDEPLDASGLDGRRLRHMLHQLVETSASVHTAPMRVLQGGKAHQPGPLPMAAPRRVAVGPSMSA